MTGKYRHSIDAKGRLSVPARLREELGDSFYITIGLRHSLMILTEQGWAALEEKKRQLPLAEAQNMRFFFANAIHCVPDKQSRVLLPLELRQYAGLQENAVIIGVGDKAEIWDAATYDAMEQAFLTQGDMDAIFASLNI
ncbi:MAG: division/cell wall cluster transcriptional repressor MraZ [Oscillospiraceae bacterium]|nr:division/cell wall cluster transcriptional repressor MraZ [Oscillospiraceae bacterium]